MKLLLCWNLELGVTEVCVPRAMGTHIRAIEMISHPL